jgi:hypothetical protein
MDKFNPNELALTIGLAVTFALLVVIAARDYHAGKRRSREEKFAEELENEEGGGLLKPDPWTDPE